MIGTYLTAPIAGLVGFLVGLIMGQFFRFRRVRYEDTNGKQHQELKFEIDRHPFNRWGGYLWRVGLSALFLFSTLYLVDFTATQRECNGDFRQSSKVLREIAAADRALEARDDKLRDEKDIADVQWITDLLALQPGSRDESIRITIAFQRTLQRINAERATLTDERSALEVERRKQPDPTEGCDR